MQELFVSYEQALKLRSLGFDEECLARYCVVTEWEKPTGEVRLQISSDCPNNHKTLFKAPLYQQVFDWFREKHNFYVNIFNDPINSMNFRFYYSITESGYLNYYESCDDEIYFETVIEARQAALNKLIEIVENEKSN